MAKKQKNASDPSTLRRLFRLLELTVIFALGAILTNLDRIEQWSHLTRLPAKLTAAQQKNTPAEELHGTVTDVYDGDTCTLMADDQKYRIRFYGIDAPEIKQDGGIVARERLRHKILNKNVRIEVVDQDRYGRTVGKVFLGTRYINLEMAAEGTVWYYQAYAKKARDLRDASEMARKRKWGIWRNPDPQPPWEFRK